MTGPRSMANDYSPWLNHPAPCALYTSSAWRLVAREWRPQLDCTCPPTGPESVDPIVVARTVGMASHDSLCRLSLPMHWRDTGHGFVWARRALCSCPPHMIPRLSVSINPKDPTVIEPTEEPPVVAEALLHDAPCPLSRAGNWRLVDGSWQEDAPCGCPQTGEWVEPVVDIDADATDAEVVSALAAGGIVPGDTTVIAGDENGPEQILPFPDVTAVRGGMSFYGGWCAPSNTIYGLLGPSKPLTKKQLRERVEYLEKALNKEQKRRHKAERKAAERVARLQRIIERLG